MGKYILRRFILRAGICCAVCLILLFHMSWYMFLCPQYHYGNLVNRLLSWNLRELGNYPEHQIIYVKPTDEWRWNINKQYERTGTEAEDLLTWYEVTCADIEVGVYPYLDEELEKEIRALGYPFDFHGITYVGTDDYDDIKENVGPFMINLGYEVETAEKLKDPNAEILTYSSSPFFPYDAFVD